MLEIVVICMVCCIDQETFDNKHSPVAHTVVKIISQFKAQTLSVRVGSRVKGSDPVPSLLCISTIISAVM